MFYTVDIPGIAILHTYKGIFQSFRKETQNTVAKFFCCYKIESELLMNVKSSQAANAFFVCCTMCSYEVHCQKACQ